jgi:hypothetical protein
VRRLRHLLLAAGLACASPDGAAAQIFLAERPHPEFMVGPLFVRAGIDPALGDIPVDLLFSLFVPPTVIPGDLEQDLYLIWPGAIQSRPDAGELDPKLGRLLEGLGLTVIGHGRTELLTRSLFQITSDGDFTTGAPPETIPGGATFVTMVRENGALGLSAPATLVRIPWTQRLVNRAWIMDLRLVTRGLIKPKPATWMERTLWGQRYRLALGFHDVRQRSVFPIYFWNRERVVRLSEDPSQLIVNFATASRLKIDEMYPQSAQRRLSESQEDTDVVSLFLDRSEGLAPQVVAVQFGYFSGLQAWAPVLIPILFFALGNLAGPLVRELALWGGRALSARVAFGRSSRGEPRERGTIVPRETLARIVPGQTRYEQVLEILGPHPEEHEHTGAPDRKTLIYRGRRIVPERRGRFLVFSTVDGWNAEHHEVEVELDRGVVSGVQARVRRTHPASPAER